jgi:hypothetical protein
MEVAALHAGPTEWICHTYLIEGSRLVISPVPYAWQIKVALCDADNVMDEVRISLFLSAVFTDGTVGPPLYSHLCTRVSFFYCHRKREEGKRHGSLFSNYVDRQIRTLLLHRSHPHEKRAVQSSDNSHAIHDLRPCRLNHFSYLSMIPEFRAT